MAVTRTSGISKASLTALVLGFVAVSPHIAVAQQQDHRGRDGGDQHQPAPRAVPAPRAAPPPAAAMDRGGYGRPPGQWNGQQHPAPANPGANNWQARGGQPYRAPGQVQPAYRGNPGDRGQTTYPGQPAYQGQPRGNGGRSNSGGQWHNGSQPDHDRQGHDGDRRGYDTGQWRGERGGDRRGDDGGQDHRREWSHDWRRDNRYDWRDYREANRDEFHVGRYYAPYRGYDYNRLSVGFYLQPLFFGADYWIADPWDYRLPPAYGPYHWVRYYNDVILVDTYTGEVADVIYDFFW